MGRPTIGCSAWVASRPGTSPTARRRPTRSAVPSSALTDFPVEDREHVPSEEIAVPRGRTMHVPKSLKGVAGLLVQATVRRGAGRARLSGDRAALSHRHLGRHPAVQRPTIATRRRRFKLLIDTLYEHGVKLLAAADGEPDRLYARGDGRLRVRAHRLAIDGDALGRISRKGPMAAIDCAVVAVASLGSSAA